jgi:hypothetical protein
MINSTLGEMAKGNESHHKPFTEHWLNAIYCCWVTALAFLSNVPLISSKYDLVPYLSTNQKKEKNCNIENNNLSLFFICCSLCVI